MIRDCPLKYLLATFIFYVISREGIGWEGKIPSPFTLPFYPIGHRQPSIHHWTGEFLIEQSVNRDAHVIRIFPWKRPEICPWEIFVPACAIPSRNFIIILFQRHKNIFTTKPQKNNKEQQQKKTRFILQRRNFSNFKTLT